MNDKTVRYNKHAQIDLLADYSRGDSQQKPESESEINSLGEDVKSQKFDKFYKYDMQLKKFEISAAQKDLEIASLAKELEKLSSQIRMREQ